MGEVDPGQSLLIGLFPVEGGKQIRRDILVKNDFDKGRMFQAKMIEGLLRSSVQLLALP